MDLAEKKNIDFTYGSGIDRLITLFDQDKIERILFNLLSNAFKFTPENGRISVELNIAEEEQEHVLLEIKVRDTGIGIPPDMQQRIFETFFQSKTPESILNQGSGIGLAITREFVEMHEGSIKVESEVNKGSCFTILLPVIMLSGPGDGEGVDSYAGGEAFGEANSGQPDGSGEIAMTRAGVGMAAGEGGKEKKVRVLLVEDNEDFGSI